MYIGYTGDLVRRVWDHKSKAVPGFTAKYNVTRLVWYEVHDDVSAAMDRETRLKRWRRDWKIRLIETDNPDWRDLYPAICN